VITVLEWLLDLDHIRLAKDAPLLIKWHAEAHAWVLFCVGVFTLALVSLIYRRERLSRTRRVVLAALRFFLAALVVAVFCEPALVLQQNRVEPSQVVLLVDTSMSMNTADVYRDEAMAARVAIGSGVGAPEALPLSSRLSLVRAALRRDDAAPIHELLERNAVQLMTFADRAEVRQYVARAGAVAALTSELAGMTAVGRGTDIAAAIGEAIAKAQGRRLAGIVLASDGRSTQATDLQEAIDLASGRQIPVYPVRIGSAQTPRNVAIGPVTAQDTVFINDLVAVEAQVSLLCADEETAVVVRLIDESSNEVLAAKTVVMAPQEGGATHTVELHTKPTTTGAKRFRVEAQPLDDEQVLEDNADRVDLIVLDNRLHILYVDGYPRYEYRYLKNALLREQTVELSVLLLEADEHFVQEGTEPIRRFPETPEELNRYDVVLFGDVDPRGGWLTDAQMTMLLDFVGNHGGGFGLIAGERHAPYQLLGTPLEKLVPVRIDPEFSGRYERPLASGFRPALTMEGRRSRLFRFSADREESEDLFSSLPDLYWVARNLGAKPGASVLLEHPSLDAEGGRMPVVVTGRYGAGKVFFQGTDDTWRWRRHTGEWIHDSYWVQVVRWLMPGARLAQDRRFVLRTDKRVYRYGDAVRVQVEISDTRLLSAQGDTIGLTVQPATLNGAVRARDAAVESQPITAHRIGRDTGVFEAACVPPHPGSFFIVAEELTTPETGKPPSVSVRIEQPDLEAQHPEADYEALERIAGATGGRVLELDELVAGFAELKDRSVLIPDDIVEPLWDSKLILILFSLIITVEWTLRKWWGVL